MRKAIVNQNAASLDFGGIDRFRIAAAILVIAIHTSPLLSFSKIGDIVLSGILARVAVPFFFMATGYFLFSERREKPFSYAGFFKKNAALYGIAILLFLPLSIYAGYFDQRHFFLDLLKDVLFNGTLYHLWYFPAVILGVGIVTLLLRRFRFETAFFIAFVLYLIGLFGDSYYGFTSEISILRGFYHILFQCFDYTRNGLFFAPFYLMLGSSLSKHEPLPRRHCILGLSISLPFMVTEGLLLHLYSKPRHDSMYLALIFCMYFLFQLLLQQKSAVSKRLRRISLLIYLIHPWCIVLIRGFAKVIGIQDVLVHNSIIFFLLVTICSVCISIMLNFLWEEGGKLALIPENRFASQKDRAWAEIDRSSLRFNLVQLEQMLPENCRIMAVVKADAYGHGAVPVAKDLQVFGIDAFAVASMEEGILLRKSGIKGTILVLGYTQPQYAGQLIRYHLTQTAVDSRHATALNQAAARHHASEKLQVHLKVDTGMHRLGEGHEHLKQIREVFELSNLKIDGMFTHLCVSDSSSEEDIRFTRYQLKSFYSLVDSIAASGYSVPALHIQSSYGLLNYPELRCSFARIGIALYGALSQKKDKTKIQAALKPALSIKARISVIKELAENDTVGYGRQFKANNPMRIATVSIGYADGIPRNLKNGYVLINGKRAPIIGRICMDQLTVDVTEIPDAVQGGIATILGQDGGETITAEQLAQKAGTITNELFSRLGSRLERVYI